MATLGDILRTAPAFHLLLSSIMQDVTRHHFGWGFLEMTQSSITLLSVHFCPAVLLMSAVDRTQAFIKDGISDTMIISAHGSQSVICNRIKPDQVYVCHLARAMSS